MDFLNRAGAQLTELFRSMTPGARITAVLLLAVVVTSLGYLFKYQASGPGVYLLSGEFFTRSDMDAALEAFGKANLDGYQTEGSRIRIPRNQESKYLKAMADNNAMPSHAWSATNEAQKATNWLESRDQREQRNKVAKEKDLSVMVSMMQGIEFARVGYETEVKPGLNKEKITRAGVSVKPRGSLTLKEEQVLDIRRMVAGYFADLPPERVTVTDLNTGKAYYGSPDGQGSAMDDPYIARKQKHEQWLTAKVQALLNYIPGVNVEVNVELDKSRETRQEAVTHEAKTVLPYQVSEKTTTRTMEGSAPGGRPGPLAQSANQPATLSAQRGKGSHEQEEKSEQQTYNAVPAKRTETTTVGLTPQRVSVTVNIPTSYYRKVWQEQNPAEPGAQPKTPDPKDLEKIATQVKASVTKQVANLVPKPEGAADPSELVVVNDYQPITPPTLPEPTTKEQALSWLAQSWSTVGLILLGLVSLVMLRSMVRSIPAAEPATASPSGPTSAAAASVASAEQSETEEAPTQAPEPVNRLKRFRKPGTSLRDELSELVSEDPDTAASVLRAWIGNAT